MQTLFFSLLIGFVAGVIGSVYRFVLAYEPILNFWFRFGSRYERKWFFKPVWGCAKCFSGQLAGWVWLLGVIVPAVLKHLGRHGVKFPFWYNTAQTGAGHFLGLISAICAAIATAVILGPILESKNKLNR